MAPTCSKLKRLSLNNSIICSLLAIHRRKKERNKRKIWTREVFTEEERKRDGYAFNLIPKLKYYWEKRGDRLYLEYCRMNPNQFEFLLELVQEELQKQNTRLRESISPRERLYVTLRYLATGNSYRTLSLAFRIGKSTVAEIIPETCNALWKVLSPMYLPPIDKPSMLQTAKDYYDLWNFPNGVGSIDGKHINLVAPPNSGSQYFNYKGAHSIVLMAVSDAKYKFTFVDIGNYGRFSDGGDFGASALGRAIEHDNFFPPPRKLENSQEELPFCFVAYDAFPLKENLLKPFSGRELTKEKLIFNYRLSRARRCVENAFGILSARFRCLRNNIPLRPINAEAVVKATVCLHNFLLTKEYSKKQKHYCPKGFADYIDAAGKYREGEWRREPQGSITKLQRQGSNAYKKNAALVREKLKEYFLGPGKVSRQDEYFSLH